jgi:hypothetical protein
VENSSQDVSAFAVMGTRVGTVKVELVDMIAEAIVDGMGDKPSCELKRGEASSGVVTEDDDGDGGGTTIGWGLGGEHRVL